MVAALASGLLAASPGALRSRARRRPSRTGPAPIIPKSRDKLPAIIIESARPMEQACSSRSSRRRLRPPAGGRFPRGGWGVEYGGAAFRPSDRPSEKPGRQTPKPEKEPSPAKQESASTAVWHAAQGPIPLRLSPPISDGLLRRPLLPPLLDAGSPAPPAERARLITSRSPPSRFGPPARLSPRPGREARLASAGRGVPQTA